MVKHPRGTFLHHNFICAVLNDVFGIQARGGLNSNLNYGSDILGIDDQLLKEYEKLLHVETQKEIARVRKLSAVKLPETPIHNEHLRPGFCRVSLQYFMSDSELAFVLEALKMVATEGWKILPQYVVNPETGQWKHHTCSIIRDMKSLHLLRFKDGKISACERRVSGPGIFPQTYTECLQTARNLFNRARKLAMKCSTVEPEMSFNPRIDYLRWFMLPKEAHDLLLGRSANVKHIVPFDPSGYTGARKSLHFTRSNITSSPTLGSSPRHFSLSAIDDCQIFRLKQKQKFYSRESSLRETPQKEEETPTSHPVKFAVGESVSPLRICPQTARPLLMRSRCYSLGSDNPTVALSAQTKLNLGLKETSPNNIIEKASTFCNCGSQTDLQSLDDPMISPPVFPYSAQSSSSTSDCSQLGRSSPTTSLASQTSEDLQAYVKEMTKEIATEIKSEIREVISRVDDILENSDALEQSNASLNSVSSQSDKNSVSVMDVTEYLMGMSKEMASEVKSEIREMVNQVDEMISPEYTGYSSRKSSPPQTGRKRIGSGPELGLDLQRAPQCLRKCPTSPVLPVQLGNEEENRLFKRSPSSPSPKSAQCTPLHEASGPNSISFNSSETSTPDTIIQVMTSQNSPNIPKSISSNKLSDDESCLDAACRNCCVKKNWCQNPSVSSQDSGINMCFTETDSYLEFVKWRTSSDPTTNKAKKLQGRLRMCQKHDKNEVPDIIEGVPVCPGDHGRLAKRYNEAAGEGRVVFDIPDEQENKNRCKELKRSSRSSNTSSGSDNSSRSSGYGTDGQRDSRDELFEKGDAEAFKPECCWEETEQDDSSACSDASFTDFTLDDEGKWHCPPKQVWKPTVEAQSDVDPLHLMAYCRTLGVKFIYQDKLDDDESERRNNSRPQSLHRWSSHAVRRRAYAAAAAHGYGVAALAQHLDHAARAEHSLRIIRPLIYVRESALRAFGCARGLPDFRAYPSGDLGDQGDNRDQGDSGDSGDNEHGSRREPASLMCFLYLDSKLSGSGARATAVPGHLEQTSAHSAVKLAQKLARSHRISDADKDKERLTILPEATPTTAAQDEACAASARPEPIDIHPRKRKIRAAKEAQLTKTDVIDRAKAEAMHHPNAYQMYIHIRKQIENRQKTLQPVKPKPPKDFNNYLMNSRNYTLQGNVNPDSVKIVIPTSVPLQMAEEFKSQAQERNRMETQHLVEREKLVLAVEQEILRIHGRAERAVSNQAMPYSVCTILRGREIYSDIPPEQEDNRGTRRVRCNGRQINSWLQEVDDKWEKIKEGMLRRQHIEAETLHAVQKMSWEWKLQDVGLCDAKTKFKTDPEHVP
ncbi:hypothetical protein MSG28_009321, partial [Choristoneura fumiferana]